MKKIVIAASVLAIIVTACAKFASVDDALPESDDIGVDAWFESSADDSASDAFVDHDLGVQPETRDARVEPDATRDAGICCVIEAGSSFPCGQPETWECINGTAQSCAQPGACLTGNPCLGLLDGLPGTVEACP